MWLQRNKTIMAMEDNKTEIKSIDVSKPILVTGVAGVIGFYLGARLLGEGREVIGMDNLNPYYDVSFKQSRLSQLQHQRRFHFLQMDISDRSLMERFFRDHDIDVVVHLAAQAGVRYSLSHPHVYVDSNLVGFMNVL